MTRFGIAVLLLVGLPLTGCGSSNSINSNTNNVNGNWNATLVSGDNSSMFQFATSLTADSKGYSPFQTLTSPQIRHVLPTARQKPDLSPWAGILRPARAASSRWRSGQIRPLGIP